MILPSLVDKARYNVAVIVLHWNCVSDTLRCLHSIFASNYDAFQVIIVDNASRDGSAAVIRENYPDVPILENDENLGYAGGNNVGLRYALSQGTEYVMLLNDDAVVAPETIPTLVDAALAHPEAGFLGPKIYITEDPQRILSAGRMKGSRWQFAHRGIGELDCGQYDRLFEVDALSGCALFVTHKAIETVGMLDEQFFAYQEDTEWCYRGRQAGFKVLFVPEARVWHPDTRARDVDSPLVTYYTSRNHLLFVTKHRLGTWTTLRVLAGHLRTLVSWSLHPRWRHKRCQRDALARAILDFARGRFGKAEGLN